MDDLTDNARIGREWRFYDHGHRELEWSAHCNSAVTRLTLHRYGVTLTGRAPAAFVADVPDDLVTAEMQAALPTLTDDILAWAPPGVAWTQRYLVTTYYRVLFSLTTGTVTSKRAALLWAEDRLDEQARPLLRRAPGPQPWVE